MSATEATPDGLAQLSALALDRMLEHLPAGDRARLRVVSREMRRRVDQSFVVASEWAAYPKAAREPGPAPSPPSARSWREAGQQVGQSGALVVGAVSAAYAASSLLGDTAPHWWPLPQATYTGTLPPLLGGVLLRGSCSLLTRVRAYMSSDAAVRPPCEVKAAAQRAWMTLTDAGADLGDGRQQALCAEVSAGVHLLHNETWHRPIVSTSLALIRARASFIAGPAPRPFFEDKDAAFIGEVSDLNDATTETWLRLRPDEDVLRRLFEDRWGLLELKLSYAFANMLCVGWSRPPLWRQILAYDERAGEDGRRHLEALHGLRRAEQTIPRLRGEVDAIAFRSLWEVVAHAWSGGCHPGPIEIRLRALDIARVADLERHWHFPAGDMDEAERALLAALQADPDSRLPKTRVGVLCRLLARQFATLEEGSRVDYPSFAALAADIAGHEEGPAGPE